MHAGGFGRRAWSRAGVVLTLAGVGGVALRVWVYRSSLGTPNSDEAVVGLMARHVIHGELTTFFWGQAYGGSQEALLTAPVFLVTGSGWLSLRLVPIILSAVAAVVVWRVGRRTIGEPAATAAAAIFWIWPPFLVFQLTHQQGFYGSDVVYCALLLLLGLRIVERPDRVRVGLFGFVFGLAFWETTQIVPIAAGMIIWTIWKQPKCLRQVWVALPFGVLGSLPWLVWNTRHGWASLHLPSGGSSTYEQRFRAFLSPVMPMMLGLRAPLSQERLLPAAMTFLALATLAAFFAYGAYRTRNRNSSILYVVAAVFPFVWAVSPRTFLEMDPRYVVVLTPVLALLVAQVVTTWVRAAAIILLLGAVSIVTLHRMEPVPPPQPMAPRSISPLIRTLDRLGLDHVYAKYWVAYVLDFDTRERIIAVENKFNSVTFTNGQAVVPDDPVVRYAPYERDVGTARHGFVFFREGLSSVPIIPQLARHGYRPYTVGPFVVYAPPS